MINIIKETRYAWFCDLCGNWNFICGDPKYKDKIMCKKCGVAFTEFEKEVDDE